MSLKQDIHITAGERVLVSVNNFEIPENRVTLLLGESGIGKSLASKALYGILSPDELSITINGRPYQEYAERPDIRALKANSFFVFQEPSTHLNPLMTLSAQLKEGSLGAAPHQDAILDKLFRTSTREGVDDLLEIYPKPYRPSGGEKQRMLLAMAFKKIDLLMESGIRDPREMFVFDEPTGSLDNDYRDLFLQMLFERFRRRNFTILLITHDYSMITHIAERHAEVLPLVVFKELSLQHSEVVLREFRPKDYLQWLKQLTPLAKPNDSPMLMSIDPEAVIFGRALCISRSRERGEPAPLTMGRGSMVYLKAPSGVGKTTIVKAVMGLLQADRITAQVGGLTITEHTTRRFWRTHIWGKQIALVFQHADEALNSESTVRQVFDGLPTMRNASEDDIKNLLAELFDVELDAAFLKKKVKYLSGGQKQRLNLLRGLSLNTDVLILDEPLNGLDFESGGKVILMLQRKQKEGKGILVISHNEEIFDAIVDPEEVFFLSATE